MGWLDGLSIYLAGPVDNVQSGEDWRAKYNNSLKVLGLKIYNPMVKPDWISELARVKKIDESTVIDMNNGIYDKSASAADEVRSVCLSMVSHSDIILCYLPKIFTIGTIDELFKADEQLKPIIFIFEPKGIVSLYAAGLFNRHIVSSSFENALNLLNDINEQGFQYFVDNKIDDLENRYRWLPLTHKAL